jgi:DNA-binding LacI/PurR family transcriptional regulator
MTTQKKFASSTDVARLAGDSQSQVSRTFQKGGSVSDGTRTKVLAAAAALDYRPSAIPRIMLTQRSHLVAVAVGGLSNPFNASALEALTVRLQGSGWQVLLVHVDSGHSIDGAISRFASYRVDAVISALAVLSREAADELARIGIPVISFNTQVVNAWVWSVSSDNAAAGRAVANLFAQRGARRFGFISGPPDSPASAERWTGFRDRLEELRLAQPVWMEGGDFTYEAGRRAILGVDPSRGVSDAIFGANDLIALGAMDELRRVRTYAVPEDVMIAGCDDIPSSSWEGYDLTTTAQDVPAMVDAAMTILSSATASPTEERPRRVVVPTRLIERGSTRRVRSPFMDPRPTRVEN